MNNFHFKNDYHKEYYACLNGFKNRSGRELVILLYHGVTNKNSVGIENFSGKHIEDKVFYEQMKYIKKHCVLLSMDDVIEIKRNKDDYPPNSVAITFDDGFLNNYKVAAPILSDLVVPATFYISSGMISTDMMFWVDKIEDCINRTLEDKISVLLGGEYCSFSLTTAEEKIYAVQYIKAFCKQASSVDRNVVIACLVNETKITPCQAAADNYAVMSWSQVKELEADENFIVGGHSLYHDILTSLDERSLNADLTASISMLEYHTGKKQKHYSYPEGQRNHYSDDIVEKLKVRGIECCPSAVVGMNPKNTSLFELKRVIVGMYGVFMPHTDPRLAL